MFLFASCPVFGQSGWETVCRNILIALDKLGVIIELDPKYNWNSEISFFPPEDFSRLERMTRTKVDMNNAFHLIHQYPSAEYLSSGVFKTAKKSYCMSIFETNKCPSPWVPGLNSLTGIVTFSEFNRKTYSSSGVKNVDVIPLGIDTEQFNPKVKPFKDKKDKEFVFLTSGDFTERKNFEGLIEAYVKEFNNKDNVTLIIKAHYQGFIRRYQEECIRRLKEIVNRFNTIDPPRILFFGHKVPWQSVPHFYTAGDCFILCCFSDDTKILTNNGLRAYNEIKEGDLVWTLNKKKQLELNPIEKKSVYNYNGTMVEIKNQSFNQLLTPNHRVYYYTPKSRNKLHIREAGKFKNTKSRYYIPLVGDWCGKDKEYIDTEELLGCKQGAKPWGDGNLLPVKLHIPTLFSIIGWYIAEGSRWTIKSGNVFSIYNEKDEIDVVNLLKKINVCGTRNNGKVCINSKVLFKILEKCGHGAKNKTIPGWCLSYSKKQLVYLYKSMMKGDGSETNRHNVYYTSSDKLKDNFIELCLKLGYSPKFWLRNCPLRYINGRALQPSTSWVISARDGKGTAGAFHGTTKINYTGKVWCVSVKNGNVFVERNGSISVSGNSRGEGIGLPYMEALASSVPVISTNFGGQTQFLNDGNSLFVNSDVKVIDDMEYIRKCLWALNHSWAFPDVNDIRNKMRFAYEFRDIMQQKGLQGRADMEKLTWQSTALAIIRKFLND